MEIINRTKLREGVILQRIYDGSIGNKARICFYENMTSPYDSDETDFIIESLIQQGLVHRVENGVSLTDAGVVVVVGESEIPKEQIRLRRAWTFVEKYLPNYSTCEEVHDEHAYNAIVEGNVEDQELIGDIQNYLLSKSDFQGDVTEEMVREEALKSMHGLRSLIYEIAIAEFVEENEHNKQRLGRILDELQEAWNMKDVSLRDKIVETTFSQLKTLYNDL